MKFVAIVLLACIVGVVDVCFGKTAKKSSNDIVNGYNKGFPYEVRVDRETIKGKAIHWYSDGHSVTVTPHRVNCTYLTNTVDAAVIKVKRQKEAQKKGKKDAKNLDKAIKELKKLRDKSSDTLHPLYDEAIEMFQGASEAK